MDQFFSGLGGVVFWLVLAAVAPLLTMRLFAEERASGTLEMLLTAPVRDWQVVVAKFVACYGFYLFMWLPTLLYLPILTGWTWTKTDISIADHQGIQVASGYVAIALVLGVALLVCLFGMMLSLVRLQIWKAGIALVIGVVLAGAGALLFAPVWTDWQWYTVYCSIDPWPVVTSYLGLALAGAMFIAIGMFVSSLVKSQLVAALIALFFCAIFVVGGVWKPDMDAGSLPAQIVYYLTIPDHFERNFGRGLIDTRNIVLYASVTLLGLFLTVRSLESRRWQ
jgi:ABC-type transport system involved in multi-copper enzyme maturation permease subunit